ncbi:glycosyltransferase family 2 protein [Nonlabens sp. SY33080]|uniref:glycosyltransferase family 2 protein n=1 Tax=Nonlabens sp. SY33080 TaxID=2719911 RepID=UPI0014289A9A|nr:glycosyltransferase [Nonlabens sp. SY33080]
MKITIGIPTFNDDPNRLIDQLVRYYSNVIHEIIIYNDASTIPINVSSHKLVTCLNGIQNLGDVESRRKIAEAATTDWILFIDADIQIPTINFTSSFLVHLDEFELVYATVTYQETLNNPNHSLRWKYGISREQRKPSNNNEIYKYFVSACFIIQKKQFLDISKNVPKGYGLDIWLAKRFKEEQIKINHASTRIIHLGLEENRVFYNKSIEGIKNTALQYKNGQLDGASRPVITLYERINSLGLSSVFTSVVTFFKPRLEQNILGKNPNLRFFDILKLYHFIKSIKA